MSGLKLVGYPVSPFVRKVRLTLAHKGVPYDLDPVVPFTENAKILLLNPKGSVPVLVTEDGPMAESGEIVRWIDARWPEPPILPADPAMRARAEAVEAWADSRFAQVFGGGVFMQRVILPYYLERDGDPDRLRQAVETDGPALLSELEARLGDGDWLAGDFGLADIAVGSWVRAALLAGFPLDRRTLPGVAAWVDRLLATRGFAAVAASEDAEPVAAYLRSLPPLRAEDG
jgi:glutathione S-transferase